MARPSTTSLYGGRKKGTSTFLTEASWSDTKAKVLPDLADGDLSEMRRAIPVSSMGLGGPGHMRRLPALARPRTGGWSAPNLAMPGETSDFPVWSPMTSGRKSLQRAQTAAENHVRAQTALSMRDTVVAKVWRGPQLRHTSAQCYSSLVSQKRTRQCGSGGK
jgi:hypothetical protein